MNTFWLELLPALGAVAASLLGIVVGISQLTSASRLRRRATFWNEQLQATDLAYDRAVAQSMHREATATLIALQVYPGRALFWHAQFILIGLYGAGATGYIAGTLSPDRITFQDLQSQGVEPPMLLVLVAILAIGLINVANILERRRRTARQYLDGQDLIRESQYLDETESTRGSFLAFLGLLSFSMGICLLIAAVCFAAGTPKEGDPTADSLASGWYLGGLFVGAALFSLGLISFLNMFTGAPNWWHYPRPLSPEAGKLQGGEQHGVKAGVSGDGSESQVSTRVKWLPAFRLIRRSTRRP